MSFSIAGDTFYQSAAPIRVASVAPSVDDVGPVLIFAVPGWRSYREAGFRLVNVTLDLMESVLRFIMRSPSEKTAEIVLNLRSQETFDYVLEAVKHRHRMVWSMHRPFGFTPEIDVWPIEPVKGTPAGLIADALHEGTMSLQGITA